MWPNPQKAADFVTFPEEIFNGHFIVYTIILLRFPLGGLHSLFLLWILFVFDFFFSKEISCLYPWAIQLLSRTKKIKTYYFIYPINNTEGLKKRNPARRSKVKSSEAILFLSLQYQDVNETIHNNNCDVI